MNKKKQIQKETDSCKENIERLEELLQEEEEKPTAEQWLLNFLSQPFTVKFTKGYITYYLGEQWIFQQDLKNNYLWIYYNDVWKILQYNNGLKYDEIQSLIKEVVGEVLNCKEFTPNYIMFSINKTLGEALNQK